MPTYVYETIPADAAQPPRRFEVEQRMSDKALERDPETGLPVRRVISGGLGFIAHADAAAPQYCGRGACGIPECQATPPPTHACHPGCAH